MDLLLFFTHLNYYLALPSALLLFVVAVWLTIYLKCIQLRALPRFFSLIRYGVQGKNSNSAAINPFYALFTAMSTSIGIGTIVGPSVAILTGGPGALCWLLFYTFFGSVTKFAEVTFAVHFRKEKNGFLVGGPMQYLATIVPWLGTWYAATTMFLFAGWSGLQANVIAEMLSVEYLPTWCTGLLLALFVFIMLQGGAERIGFFNSRLVPIMFTLYVSAGLLIVLQYRTLLYDTFALMITSIFSPMAPIGGFLGSSIMAAFCSGIYKGAFITEAGMGTASIPHAIANVQKPTDQGILAMMSVFVDTFLCLLSGLLILITGAWKTECVSNALMYQVFQQHFPVVGRPILIFSITMFVIGTILGNSFNGRQSFATITHDRWLLWYYLFVCCTIFFGAISNVPLVWAIMEVMLPLVAIPNVLGIVYLSLCHKKILTT